MVRTQIQLTEDQARRLKSLASRRQTSVAEVVRDAVDKLLRAPETHVPQEARRRAADAAGRYASGHRDTSRRHDHHLAEAYRR